MPNGNQPDAVRAPDTACFLNGLLNRFDLFIGDMEDHVRVGRVARVGQVSCTAVTAIASDGLTSKVPTSADLPGR